MANYSIKHFDRQTRKLRIPDPLLCKAVEGIREGQPDAALGGGLFKQRVARPGEGRSGGLRVVLCLRNDDTAIFLTAFAKSDQDNLTERSKRPSERQRSCIRS
ncbi:MAG: type II toxin-antitoxin system RelE/ParE family toxin [Boseongicola sp. SB0664_bin_43]|uniref:Type II toxin-antitoxin system RelE/ParE family toxin n=1 Tax=Boseongicola sp. SB0664_bin_43 TaxID=2604844 RepID=A0A6B0Y173_9RHOB|nr:type II toxin-antitoxin system RelE/ParE family toxin [Boseongicola sp. SB0664_bin_43]MYK31785.1 type II toxin-antitoxin system RelE/ParE family toxin [Boseongicola sp. SB0670_bin_30]